MKRVLFAVALAFASTVPSVAVSAELYGQSGKWEYRLKVTHPGTRSEGSWGTLSYDGKKVPDGTALNDFYRTPWGNVHWVGMPKSRWGRHGWMLGPVRGRELHPPVVKVPQVENPLRKSFRELVQALKSEQKAVRVEAARKLGEMGPTAHEALVPLIRAIRPSDGADCNVFHAAIGRIGSPPPEAKAELIELLTDPRGIVRHHAGNALHTLGPADEALVRRFLRLAKHQDAGKRVLGVEILGRLNSQSLEIVTVLSAALRDGEPEMRRAAVEALGRTLRPWRREPGPRLRLALPALKQALKDSDRIVRDQAIAKLGERGPAARSAEPALIELLKTEKGLSVRSRAAWALGRFGPAAKNAVPALIDALTDKHVTIRANSATALGRIGSETAVGPLIVALDDPHSEVRAMAAQALGRFGPRARAAVPALRRLSDDKSQRVRKFATEALRRVGLSHTKW